MRTKQNKTIKILLAVAFMFTAFLMLENTIHAKTKRSTYRTINGIYNADGTIDTADGNCWKVCKESYAYPGTTVVTVKFNTHGIQFMWKLLKVFLPEVNMGRMEKVTTLRITNV